MKIGLDFDSTLSYFLEATLEKYNFLYDDNLKPEDIKTWNMEEYLKCTKQEMYDLWTPTFIASVPVREYARQVVDLLKSMDHKIIVATAYHRSMCEEKVNWLEKYLGLNENDVVFINKKYLLDVDMLLDDGLHNFLDEYGLPTKFEKVVLDQPYNQNSNNIGTHYRIKSLSELPKIVELIEKDKLNQRNIIIR